MKFENNHQLSDFVDTVEKCKEDVLLKSIYGDVYNLKSVLSRYLAIAALLGEHGDELEIFCCSKDDEKYFFDYFERNPDVLPLPVLDDEDKVNV